MSSEAALPKSVQRVVDAAANAGLDVAVVEYPADTRTAVQAADAVGCKVDQIVKSMVFDADGELVLALTSGANQVDADRLSTVAGVGSCGRADPDEVRRVTGFAIGGVAPIGHLQPIRTWIDPYLLTFSEVWAAAGSPRHVFPLEPGRLAELTDATPADFTVPTTAPTSEPITEPSR
ncbi:MAG: YbaK/EbsC family protein [Acidimicrobiales bacterium]